MNEMVDQLVQLAGSAVILAAFAGAQTGRLNQKSRRYLLANALGGAALAFDAAYYHQWGFLLLEGAWAIVSLIGMLSAEREPARDRSQIVEESWPSAKDRIEVADLDAVLS
jgi:hypothetical protein